MTATQARKERPRILLVEDHRAMRESLARLLTSSGYEVVACRDLGEAYRSLATRYGPYDVAVVDLNLPDGNGSDFVRDMRSLPYNATTRIVVCTATSPSDRHLAEAVSFGADAVYFKPIDFVDRFLPVLRGESPGDDPVTGWPRPAGSPPLKGTP